MLGLINIDIERSQAEAYQEFSYSDRQGTEQSDFIPA